MRRKDGVRTVVLDTADSGSSRHDDQSFLTMVLADCNGIFSNLSSMAMRELFKSFECGTIGPAGIIRKFSRRHSPAWVCLPLGVWLVSVLSLGPLLGPVMHESDQASLVDGAIQLSRGHPSPPGAGLYNYDKQFLSYWIMAGVVRLFPEVDPILSTNAASFVIFWGGLLILLLAKPARTGSQAAATAAVILAPALWQHSAFLASNFLAGGFFFLAIAVWQRGRGLPRVFSIFLLGGSVACRADMLLILPLVAWLLLPRRELAKWISEPWLWGIALAGAAAFATGSLLATEKTRNFYTPFFIPKIYAAYAIFGLGASGLVFIQWMAGAGRIGLSRRQLGMALHSVAGGVAILPVFFFYSVQMFSTRHWTAMLCGLMACCVSRRAPVIIGTGWGPVISWGALLLAVSPLFIGLRLPFPDTPSLSYSSGTAFPTADGELSMGGYWHRLGEIRDKRFFHDHNQPVWLAARNAQLHPGPDGRVPVLGTTMQAYYKLAARLKGFEVDVVEPEADGREYYLDSRHLLRDSRTVGTSRIDRGSALLAGRGFEIVSPSFAGIEMLLSIPGGGVPALLREQAAIAAAFGGNSHRMLGDPSEALSFPGHTLVLYHGSPQMETPLAVFEGKESLEKFVKAGPPAMLRVPARRIPEALDDLARLAGNDPHLKAAIGQLPAYMDIGSLR